MEFTDQQKQRYNRHILLQEFGEAGQRQVMNARVLVVGAGGLGSPVLLYLAAAGVGTIGIVDDDTVEISNLQRQVVHFTDDLGKPKVGSAREKLQKLNPDIRINIHHEYLDRKNMPDRIAGYDFIIDGTDNFSSKFLLNDLCVAAGKPFCHAGVLGFEGQMMTILPGESACFRCVFPEPPPPDMVSGSSRVGVLGALAGMFGTLQAAETIKFLAGAGSLLTNRLLICDMLDMQFRVVQVSRRPGCTACGAG